LQNYVQQKTLKFAIRQNLRVRMLGVAAAMWVIQKHANIKTQVPGFCPQARPDTI
jgi:hypothetical protein